ncbi:MAG: TlpA disulfide reductase family protein [Polyangiaceae bacterium]
MTRAAETKSQRGDNKGGVMRMLLLVAALGVGLALVAKRPSGPPVGAPAADFDLASTDGTQVTLASLRGAPVVMEVFASWCSACRRSAPMLRDAATSQRKQPVHFLGINVDDDSRLAARVKQAWQIPYPVLHDDGSVAAKYKVQVLPTFVVLDAEGNVRHVSAGSVSEEVLESWLGDLGAARL